MRFIKLINQIRSIDQSTHPGAASELAGVNAGAVEQHSLAEKILAWLQNDVEHVKDFRLDMLVEKV